MADAYNGIDMIDDQIDAQATVASLHKTQRYRNIGIAAFIVMLLAWGAYFVIYNMTVQSNANVCYAQEQEVEKSIRQYTNTNGLTSYPAYIDGIGVEQPECPDGGDYVWNPITGEYTCTKHGHFQ